ncbi:MAG TPA: efflux RND transporter periplasmic adaptor subunit [Holophagaceae bacterium]|jgi:Cu(I)/Ag(I) efflux system membrane fusion protein|nr:efflux RND transporter periplasmic adaptor subunit [Holophagaceae bacterium]
MTPKRFGPTLTLLAAGLLAGSGATWMIVRHRAAASVMRYHCPMHPEVVRDEPGECPVCGMRLVADNASAPSAPTERKVAFYRNPMDPSVHSPVPMDDPMGMAYIPVYEDELSGAASVPGLADITIDPAYQRLIGVRTVGVEEGPVGGAWTAPAKVAVDETRVRKITTKTGGFVDRLFVDFMGKPVRKGKPLFAIYSPDLYSAQQDLALAVKSKDALGGDGAALVQAAAKRLRLWDVPEADIQRLEQGGEPQRDLIFVSPVSGVVTSKNVLQGARLQPGDTPFEVTDLSKVWVSADAYAMDLPKLKTGAKAAFTSPALPGRTFTGRVAFIDPVIDPQTRTAKVRLAFANSGGELRPETYGEATFQGSGRKGLRVPFSAVIDDGDRKVVFVDEGNGHFVPHQVDLGSQDADWAEVKSGLKNGDRVADKATFLLDSEARRRAALSGGAK